MIKFLCEAQGTFRWVQQEDGGRLKWVTYWCLCKHKAYLINNTLMPLGIHKLNIRKLNHYISTTSVLLFIYEQIILNKTMFYNVVFWQSSALTDKILKSNSKLSACRFWSVSVKSLIVSRRIYWITVGKIESILKISVSTRENTSITRTSGFWDKLFLLLERFIFCSVYVRVWWFCFGYLAGLCIFFL